MDCSRGPLLSLLVLFLPCASACQNFLVQQCTDIPFAYLPISSTKCIQLLPNSYNPSINYPVQNYIVIKSSPCYNIVSFNSTSTVLFFNECREQCAEDYCLLFDAQSNTSIINIFYSSSSKYDLSSASLLNTSSYDYLPFDDCSSSKRTDRILLIVTYVLCGVIGALTIAVISKYVISWRLKKGGKLYDPYNWRWLVDCLLCRSRQDDQPSGRKAQPASDSSAVVDPRSARTRGSNYDISAQPYILSSGSSENTRDRSTHPSYNSGNSSDPRFVGFSSDNNTPVMSRPVTARYFSVITESGIDPPPMELEDLPRSSSSGPLRQRLSEKASATLSVFSSSGDYTILERQPSADLSYIRL